MRIVFMGTPEFAVASLVALISGGFNIVAVVTAPDRPAGRGQHLQESAVKKYALGLNIPVLQPDKLKDPQFVSDLKALNADLQFVVAFRMLPEAVWNMPRLGTFNLHGSLLPRFRGAAPINWAVINGEKRTGVTTFKLKHEIDTGNILFTDAVDIGPDLTAGELHDQLMEKGAALVVKTASAILESDRSGTILDFKPQEDTDASHAPKIYRETCRISWKEPVKKIHDLIRGLSPSPAAFTTFQRAGDATKTLKIFRSEFRQEEEQRSNGSVVTDNATYINVAAEGGLIIVKELQLEGKKRMTTEQFLKGFKFTSGDVFA